MKKSLFGLILFGLSLVAMTAPVHGVNLVTLTSTGSTLAETQSIAVQVKLEEPLFAPGIDPAYFHLNLTASDPSRVAISSNPVDYTSTDWYTIKNFTVTALDDGVHNTSNNVTISYLVDSNSELYNQFSGGFVLSITDINPAPTVTPDQTPTVQATTTATTPKATLAETGQETTWIQAVSLSALLASVLLMRRLARTTK